ncbi:3-oxo-5-alpha-steroid 4-dehydrogenase [compost metagenome]
MLTLYAVSGGAIFLYMVILFLAAQIKKDNSIVDIGWGMGFVIIAFVTFFYKDGFEPRQLLILVLVTLWGVRLALHLLIRSIGRAEDFRYANFRKEWGKNVVVIAFFRVFMLQGFFMLLLAYPIIRVNAEQSGGLDAAAYVGFVIWAIGFLFQAVGDAQLESFKKTRRSKEEVLTTGLWRYTRHPNYFGEAAMWWGIAVIILPVRGGWIAVFSALFMNLLLLKVSGVPFLDKRYAQNAAYQQYKKETNRFLPWFPNKTQ